MTTPANPDIFSATVKNSKLIILTEKQVSKEEMKCLYAFSPDVAILNEFTMDKKIDELMKNYDILLVDLKDPEKLKYYSLNLNYISEEVNVIYLRANGNSMSIDDIKKYSKADYCRKFLPTTCADKSDYLKQLLADHMTTKILSPSTWKRVLHFLCKK